MWGYRSEPQTWKLIEEENVKFIEKCRWWYTVGFGTQKMIVDRWWHTVDDGRQEMMVDSRWYETVGVDYGRQKMMVDCRWYDGRL